MQIEPTTYLIECLSDRVIDLATEMIAPFVRPLISFDEKSNSVVFRVTSPFDIRTNSTRSLSLVLDVHSPSSDCIITPDQFRFSIMLYHSELQSCVSRSTLLC